MFRSVANEGAFKAAYQAAKDVDDVAHDMPHFVRVAMWAARINPALDRLEVWCAAMLHDVVCLPKDSPLRTQAARLSAEKAVELLEGLLPQESLGRIYSAILTHSFSGGLKPENDLGKAIQDADRIDGLGWTAWRRADKWAAKSGRALYHAEDPFCQDREPDEHGYTVDLWFCRFLVIGETMNTEMGKREAAARLKDMESRIHAVSKETGVSYQARF